MERRDRFCWKASNSMEKMRILEVEKMGPLESRAYLSIEPSDGYNKLSFDQHLPENKHCGNEFKSH